MGTVAGLARGSRLTLFAAAWMASLLACTSTTAQIANTATPAEAEADTACAQGTSIEGQKAVLVALGSAQFSGTTDEGRSRFQFGPDARDHRRGGIWLVMEFNGDELATIALKKVALDRQMRDAYEAFYAAACDELAQIDLAAYQRAPVKVSQMGKVESLPGVVFKTRLQRDAANEIDWANKEGLDFNDIWDTLLLNPAWRKELAELKQDE